MHGMTCCLCLCFTCAYMYKDDVAYVHASLVHNRDDIEMRSNAAYGTVESQYEDVSVPDKPRDELIYN